MAARKKKPWNADMPLPSWAGGPKHVPKPAPSSVTVGHSTSPHFECLRCEQLRAGREPIVPDHSPRCSYRGTGRDPDTKG